jgi:hypothetical protein
VDIHRSTQVVGVTCAEGRVRGLTLRRSRLDGRTSTWAPTGESWTDDDFDELVLAVPPVSLVKLIRAGEPGDRLVEAAPELAEVARLRSIPVPMINLSFNRKLRHMPAEPVGLLDSRLCLAFTDISQTWEGVAGFAERTVLAVSASDLYALPGTGPDDDAHAMLVELAEYLEFDPGPAWGQSPDIDWRRTRYDPNNDAQLFVNETGSDECRPQPRSATVANLTFAGDFCQNHVGMTTIESAVTSGLQAAEAIVAKRGVGGPVPIAKPNHTLRIELLSVWLRYALAPYAAGSGAWSRGGDAVRDLAARAAQAPSVLRSLVDPGAAGGRQRRDS